MFLQFDIDEVTAHRLSIVPRYNVNHENMILMDTDMNSGWEK